MKTIQHRFVDSIPESLEPGILYVSMTYTTAVHLCACGCGNEVVTPLSPSDWKLLFDGESVTLRPSIGNWNFKCRSHYWITNDRIVEASAWESYNKKVENKPKKKKRKKRWWFMKNG